jgi:hypothetical protein
MNRETKTEPERLQRMRRMFAEQGGILEEDYNYFTRRGEPTPRSRVPHKSAARCERPSRARS